ncbi:YkgJ family cysteine cluster protein [Photobacterium sanguinicancri]|uniref:YkgJ family cysteine cluster protein n=1 Tax=Photobacterium sanguinicancri TaxID=875932 RepID=UPI000B327A1B
MLTENLKPFPCNGCGKCCANVHLSEITLPLSRGDGICRHLDTATRRCKIYDNRPKICQVELQYREHYSEQFSWDDFIAINLEICESLPDRITNNPDDLESDRSRASAKDEGIKC